MREAPDEVRRLVAGDRFRDALRACNQAIAEQPTDLELVLLKAWLLASPVPGVSAPSAAVELLREYIGRTPEVPALHLALAHAYDSGLGDYSLAAGEYRTTLQLQPDSADACLGLVLLVDAPGSGVGAQEALDCASRVADAHPQHWQLWRELGLLYWRMGRVTDSANSLRVALAHVPPQDDGAGQIARWLEQIRAGTTYREHCT